MKTTKGLLGPALLAAAIAVTGGCDRIWAPEPPAGSVQLLEYTGPVHEVCLLAEDSCALGTLTIWNDETSVYVRFTSSALIGWYLRKTKLAVGLALEDIPQSGQGRPIPGRFPHKDIFHPLHRVCTATYTLPLNGWEPGTTVYVAGQAELYRRLGGSPEITWAGCCRFPCPEWACYTTYVVQEPRP